MKQALLGILVLALLSCELEPTAIPDPPAAEPDLALLKERGGDLDDQIARFAHGFPGGFGGIFRDAEGRVTVSIVNTTAADEAAAFLLARQRIVEGRRALTRGDIRIIDARYTFRQLLAWYRSFIRTEESALMRIGDVDDRANVIRLGVESASAGERVRNTLRSLGIPDAAAVVDVVTPPVYHADLEDRIRPIEGGLRLQFSSDPTDICTIGVNVDHWEHGRSFVTASHCTATHGGVSGTVIYQNTHGSSNRIGVEVVDPSYAGGGDCPTLRVCRYSDAALIAFDDSVSWAFPKIAKPVGLGSAVIDSSDPHFWIDHAYPDSLCLWGACNMVGDTVHRVGASSGWTSGEVTAQCITVQPQGTNRAILCGMEADYESEGGDSGSPVFTQGGITGDPNHAILVGIHFAGLDLPGGGDIAYFSRINFVRDELEPNAEYDCHGFKMTVLYCPPGESPPSLSASIAGPSPVPPDGQCEWQAIVSGGETPYSYQWSGALSGSASTVSGQVNSSSWLNLTVTDDGANQDSDQFFIEVDEEAEECMS